MLTFRDLKKAAAKLNAKIEQDKIGDTICTELLSPKGTRFASGSTHIMVDNVYVPWKPDYADMINRLSYGLEPCEDKDCEWCNEN